MTVSGYPTQRSAGGFQRSATATRGGIEAFKPASPAMSQGELVPYQSGPTGSSTAAVGTANPYNKAPAMGYGGLAKLGGRLEAGLRRGAAIQRGLARASALGRFVETAVDLYEFLDLEDQRAFYQTPLRFDHPPGAELLQDCGFGPTIGPTRVDGSCDTSPHLSTSLYEAGLAGMYTDSAPYRIWRYHAWRLDGVPVADRTTYQKDQGWRAPLATAGDKPGPLIEGRVLPLPPPGLPHAGARLSGGPPTAVRVAVRSPSRRPDEKKKGLAQRGYALASAAYGGVDEARQAVDVFFDSLPPGCKRGIGKSILARAAAVARCAGSIDLGKLVVGLIQNEIEDQIIGRAQGATGKASRGLRGGIGSAITGPAL